MINVAQAAEEQLKLIKAKQPQPEQNTWTFAELWEHKDDVQPFLIPDLIPDESVAVIIGEPGIGKTQLCTQLCLSIGLGFNSFLGCDLNVKHRRTLIVATEDSRQKFTRAVVKQAMFLVPDLDPQNVGMDFTEGSNFDSLEQLYDEIKRLIAIHPYDLIVLDALSDLFTMMDGEINSNKDARKILGKLQLICNQHRTTIILIHHAAKTKIVAMQQTGEIFLSANMTQGAGAITQKPRTILALSKDPQSLSQDGRFHNNFLHVLKANLMEKTHEINAFKLLFNGQALVHTLDSMQNIDDWRSINVGTVDTPEHRQAKENAPLTKTVAGQKRKLQPREYDTSFHIDFRDSLGIDGVDTTDLKSRITLHYGVGETKARDFIPYLKEIGLLTFNEEKKLYYAKYPF